MSPIDHDSAFAVRTALIREPGDATALLRFVATLEDAASLFRWARRAVLKGTLDPVSIRRLLLQADALDVEALARWAEAAPLPDRHPLRLIGALVMRKEPRHRFDPDQPGTAFADFPRRIDWLRFTAARAPSLTTLRSGIEATLMKVAYSREFHEAGLIEEALQAGREAAAFKRAVSRRLHGNRARGFTSNWTQAIGHMVLFIHMLAARRYGLADWEHTLLEGGRIANEPLHALAESEYGTVVTSTSGKGFFEPHGSMLPEMVDGTAVDIFDFCARVDEAASRRGATVLPLPPRDGALARYLDTLGLGPTDPYVTLHCREEGYKLQGVHGPRNATIGNYDPALEYLTGRGYTVIRLGDPSMTPLPAKDRVVDYARGPDKTPELDVLLTAHAAFHIGCSSGLSLVPLLFGRPCLFLNWYPNILLPWGRHTWTVLKRLVRTDSGETVTDPQTLFRAGMVVDPVMLEHLGYALEENAPEEILEAVRDFDVGLITQQACDSPHTFTYASDRKRVQVRRPTSV